MKFAVISDVHVDINAWDWRCFDEIDGDVNTVIMAGDISNDVWEASRWLVELRKRFENVIWVAGNHDFYNIGFNQTRAIPDREWAEKWPNPMTMEQMIDHYERWSTEHGIHYLHRNSVDVNGVTFIGATGWHDFVAGEPYTEESQITVWYKILNDRMINWTGDRVPNHLNPYDAGKEDVIALQQMVDRSTGPVVVITHHIPDRSLLWQKPHDAIWTTLHGSFANTAMEKIQDPKIKLWIYGHTHQRGMKTIGETTFICNAKGYPHENPNWSPIVIEI